MSSIEDNELPKTIINRIVRQSLPDSTAVQKDAKTALIKASTVFINYITAAANDIAKSSGHKTITAQEVFKALEVLEFEQLIPKLAENYEGSPLAQTRQKPSSANPTRDLKQKANPFIPPILPPPAYLKLQDDKKLRKKTDRGVGIGSSGVGDDGAGADPHDSASGSGAGEGNGSGGGSGGRKRRPPAVKLTPAAKAIKAARNATPSRREDGDMEMGDREEEDELDGSGDEDVLSSEERDMSEEEEEEEEEQDQEEEEEEEEDEETSERGKGKHGGGEPVQLNDRIEDEIRSEEEVEEIASDSEED